MNRKLKLVRNFMHANELLDMGYRLVRIDRDKNNKSFMIFLFEFNDTIVEDLKSLNGKKFIK
ncbi:hypothetical protein [Paraclostridium sordellii]|uniref:hypothetical protein n=1 Tax=Paraclostridium sordellii TaxID=1505 RepID=UPI0005DBEA99|nr:hypothetical protein [Paeniclostridium sordellii]CEQ26781.1 Uncharacterised protein [[Clostridium] sordellii] [Paeniclostridium sordellii]